MACWRSLDKNTQNIIIWEFVCNSPNTKLKTIVDVNSTRNAYLASKKFHVLKVWQKNVISYMTRFNKLEYSNEVRYPDKIVSKFQIGTPYQYWMKIKEFDLNGKDKVAFLHLSQFGIFNLLKHVLSTNYASKDVLQDCVNNFVECGHLQGVCWLADQYDVNPSCDSLNEALIFGSYDVVSFCVKRYKYRVSDNVIFDALKTDNIDLVKGCLKEKWIEKLPSINNDILTHFILFGPAFKSIQFGLENKMFTLNDIFNAFETAYYTITEYSSYGQNLIDYKISNLLSSAFKIDRRIHNKLLQL